MSQETLSKLEANGHEIEFYATGDDGEVYWRIRCCANGEILGASSEGFHDQGEAAANAERLFRALGYFKL